MSKQGATSSKFKPAKPGAEEHNRREKNLDYIRKDLTPLNQTWEAPDFVSVEDARAKVADKYFEHHTTGKGTHKRLPSNSTPIQETVVVIREDTTMEQLQEYARLIQQTWGYRPLAIYMHLDEGHEKAFRRGKWIPNRHAHMIFDSTDDKGESLKPLSESKRASIRQQFERGEKKKADADPTYVPRQWVEPAEWARIKPFDYMQDLAAQALHMERGEVGGKKGLDALEYKAKKLEAEVEEADLRLSDALSRLDAVEGRVKSQTAILGEINAQIDQSQGKLSAINHEISQGEVKLTRQDALHRQMLRWANDAAVWWEHLTNRIRQGLGVLGAEVDMADKIFKGIANLPEPMQPMARQRWAVIRDNIPADMSWEQVMRLVQGGAVYTPAGTWRIVRGFDGSFSLSRPRAAESGGSKANQWVMD